MIHSSDKYYHQYYGTDNSYTLKDVWYLPGDARRGPVGAAGSLRAVSTVIEGPQGSWAVWWWRGPSGARPLA